jgi:hypothetical protein
MKHIIIILTMLFTLCLFTQEPTTRIEYYIIQTSPKVFDTVMVEVEGKPIWLYKNGKKVSVKIYHYDTVYYRNKPKVIKN